MESFLPKINKISLIEGPFSEFIRINLVGFPNNEKFNIFYDYKIFNFIPSKFEGHISNYLNFLILRKSLLNQYYELLLR